MKSSFKILRILISIIIFGIIKNIKNITVEEVRACIKEIIYSYYMRGKNIQFGPKDYYYIPEDATRQNLNFLTCASFTTSVYLELINTTVSAGNQNIFNYSEVYIGKRPEVVAITNINKENNLEMKYYKTNETNNYKTVLNPDFQTVLSLLEIGDILVEPDHFVIIYDIIKDNNGNKIDAVIIHSMSGGGNTYIRTKVPRYQTFNPKGDEYSKEQYSIFLTGKLNSRFEEGVEEATIRAVNLSKYYTWGNMSIPKYRKSNYAILRIIQENDKKQAILKYIETYYYNLFYKSKYKDNDIIELTNSNLDRIKFKHLYIEKIVDVNTGSIVEIGNYLTYTIIVKNCGKENYKEDLIVLENLSQYVKYEKYYTNSTGIKFEYNEKERKLKWNIGKLKSKEEKIINYQVKVISGNPNDIVENIGFVGNIPSSVVKNTIGINLNENQKNAIIENFEKLKKKYNGKVLINEIYKKSFGIDLNFDKFNITNLIINKNLNSSSHNTIYLNKSNEFHKAIVNKCWSTIASLKYTYIKGGQEVTIYNNKKCKFFKQFEIEERLDFLYEKTFKTGDILLYINRNDIVYSVENNQLIKNMITYENGEYAYIYLEGKGFLGINFGDDGKPNTLDDRNEFTAKYYKDNNLTLIENYDNPSDEFLEIGNLQTLFGKDYYIILRPSLCFNISDIKNEEKSENKAGLIIALLFVIIIVTFGIFMLHKYFKMKKEGIEFNFYNLKNNLL